MLTMHFPFIFPAAIPNDPARMAWNEKHIWIKAINNQQQGAYIIWPRNSFHPVMSISSQIRQNTYNWTHQGLRVTADVIFALYPC